MKDRGLKAVSVVQTAAYFLIALVWVLSEDRGDMVALVVLMWLLFAVCAAKLAALFVPMPRRYSAVFAGLAFAVDMALSGALLALYIGRGIAEGEAAGVYSAVLVIVIVGVLALAEAAAFVCGAAGHVEEK